MAQEKDNAFGGEALLEFEAIPVRRRNIRHDGTEQRFADGAEFVCGCEHLWLPTSGANELCLNHNCHTV